MKMNDLVNMIPAVLAGIFIGAIFFGGLWLTVRKGMASKIPGIWFVISFVLRMAVAIAGFYFVSQHSWQKAFFCLAGFLIARTISIRITTKQGQLLFKMRKETVS